MILLLKARPCLFAGLILLAAFPALLFIWKLVTSETPSVSWLLPAAQVPLDDETALIDTQAEFWRRFHPELLKFGPKCQSLIHPEETHLDISFNESDHRARPDYLNMSGTQLLELRDSHANFTSYLRTSDISPPYVRKTRGIVTTAGGAYLPVAVVSIRMLRATGSTLPVEVFLASAQEWDPHICGTVFPDMNARCIVLRDIYDAAGNGQSVQIDRYQYKVMSIVFSSFEEVLFLDSDCFPIFDPNDHFDQKPFTSTGLILWPDFWYPSESPLFFEVAGIEKPPIWSRSSTESGEIFYSKSKHAKSLLLALYYNYYGPGFYYPLQSQGAPGEGDKETFLWSAVAMGEPLYTVRQMVNAAGYITTNGEWRGSAMIQFDPSEDLAMQSAWKNAPNQTLTKKPRPLFVHANYPKFDPATIFRAAAMGAAGPTRDADGTIRRVWTSSEQDAIERFGFDLERRLWAVIRDIACEYEHDFQAWRAMWNVCQNANIYWDAIFGADSKSADAT